MKPWKIVAKIVTVVLYLAIAYGLSLLARSCIRGEGFVTSSEELQSIGLKSSLATIAIFLVAILMARGTIQAFTSDKKDKQ